MDEMIKNDVVEAVVENTDLVEQAVDNDPARCGFNWKGLGEKVLIAGGMILLWEKGAKPLGKKAVNGVRNLINKCKTKKKIEYKPKIVEIVPETEKKPEEEKAE